MALHKQHQGRWSDYDQRFGGYHTLLARVLERWVLDARGSMTDCKQGLRPMIQRNALEALATPWPGEFAILGAIAQEVGKSPAAILEGLREQVGA